jgi:heme exporter protein C
MVRIWHIIFFVWVSATIVAAFLWAPLAQKLEEYTRIMYFHIPAAWVSVVAFATAAYAAVRYLKNRDPVHDAQAVAAVRLGLVFCVLATLTGMLWAKAMWGAYWNWDPRQVSIFFLILIYGAYLTLRSAVEDPDRRARLAAVYALLAFVTVPFLMFVAPRMSSFSLHPQPIINESGKMAMHPQMRVVLFSAVAAFTVLFYWVWSIEVRIARSELIAGRKRASQE